MPNSTNKVLNAMNILKKDILIESIFSTNVFQYEKDLGNLDILFRKIEDDN